MFGEVWAVDAKKINQIRDEFLSVYYGELRDFGKSR